MKQSDLADLCGVTQQTISKIEQGATRPRDGLKLLLAEKLGTPPDVLFRLGQGDGHASARDRPAPSRPPSRASGEMSTIA